MSARPADAFGCSEPELTRTATLEALLAASYRLSNTETTEQAADELADTACALTGADGAHVQLPDQLGDQVWSNANEVRTPLRRGTLTFDMSREGPYLADCLATGEQLFVADALTVGAPWRPSRLRHAMASVLFVPLLDVGVLVLWWEMPRAAPPAFAGDWPAFVTHFAQALRRRIVTTTLRDLTRTDALTGLTNRRALLQVLESLPTGSSLLLIDLDHFKQVNDTFGHRYGDQVLQAFARLLQDHAPDALVVARHGGEEFAVVFPSGGRNVGEQAFTEMRLAWRAQGLTFSAGLAEHRDGGSGEETLEAADRALYRAKRAGRDQLAHAANVAWTESPLTDQLLIALPHTAHTAPADAPVSLDEVDTARPPPLSLHQLDEVLEGELVTPHYQPVVDTFTGRVVAVEALARIVHPDTGALLLPAQFLPLAERTGRVRVLDRQVAVAAIKQVAAWRNDPLLADLTLAINVSAEHLDDQDLPNFLIQRCGLTGLPTHALTVELTETLHSMTGRGHELVLRRLRDAGLEIALDDFGTGFSTLAYLLRFPVTTIKIDKSFTAALVSHRGRQLVRGILNTALPMGVRVIAEGVETPEQRDLLTALSCPYLQGYLFSRALPSHALPAAAHRLYPGNAS